MTVNTKTATGRRTLRFESFDDILADAEKLAAGDVALVGNWSLAKIFGHLARTMNYSREGFPFSANWLLRLFARAFFKKRFLTKTLSSGFQIPSKNREDFIPDNDETQQGLEEIRNAIQRQKTATSRVAHPFLGEFTPAEWEQFHCRHAELHMSFAVPPAA